MLADDENFLITNQVRLSYYITFLSLIGESSYFTRRIYSIAYFILDNS